MKTSTFNKWFQDFSLKNKNVETMRGFKKTVQNKEYTTKLIKKLCKLHYFFIGKTDISTKDTMVMPKLLPNENGFMGKRGPM